MPLCANAYNSGATMDAYNAGTTTAISTSVIWTSWADNATAATTSHISTGYVWPEWVRLTTRGTTTVVLDPMDVTEIVDTRTIEERHADEARHLARLAEELRQHDARRARQRDATERARALLEAMLDREQRGQLQRDKFFEIIGQDSRRRYRIHHGTHGNVRLLDDRGCEVTRYCGQPLGVPIEDAMLAQKLQIEHDEAGFLRVANGTRLVP